MSNSFNIESVKTEKFKEIFNDVSNKGKAKQQILDYANRQDNNVSIFSVEDANEIDSAVDAYNAGAAITGGIQLTEAEKTELTAIARAEAEAQANVLAGNSADSVVNPDVTVIAEGELTPVNEEKPENGITSPKVTLEDTQTGDLRRQAEKLYLEDLDDYTQRCTKDTLIETLGKYVTNPKYEEANKFVESLISKLDEQEFTSKEEIDAFKKQHKRDLSGFNKKIFDKVIVYYEMDVYNKNYEDIVDMVFEKYKRNDAINYKDLKNDLKKQLKQNNKWNTSYYQTAYNDFVNSTMVEMMNAEQRGELLNWTEGGETRRKVKRYLINTHDDKVDGNDNTYNKSVRGNKTQNTIAARHNKVVNARNNELTSCTQKELEQHLGKKLFEKLDQKYLLTCKNGDTYDLSELSEKIGERIGMDYSVTKSDDLEHYELHNIAVDLRVLTGVSDINEADAKKICKLCEYKIEKYDRNRSVAGAVADGLNGGVVSGLAAITTAKSFCKYVEDHWDIVIHADRIVNTDVNTPFGQVDVAVEIIDDLNIHIDNYDFDDIARSIVEGVEIGALEAIAYALITNLLIGTRKEYETACINNQDRRIDDIEDFKEYLSWRYPDAPGKVELLCSIADMYKTDDGKFDFQKYNEMTELIGGVGSNTNCNELLGGAIYMLEKFKIKPDPEPKPNPAPQPDKKTIRKAETTKDETTTFKREIQYKEVSGKVAAGTSWPKLAEQYDCLKELPLKQRIRYLKLAQAIKNPRIIADPGKMKTLYELSLRKDGSQKIAELFETDQENYGSGNFDKEVYLDMLRATEMPPKIKLPKNIAGCEFVYENQDIKAHFNTPADSNAKRVSSTRTHVGEIELWGKKEGTKTTYYVQDKDGKVYSFESQTERDNKAKELATEANIDEKDIVNGKYKLDDEGNESIEVEEEQAEKPVR
ncbi:MAG: hypothetical protein MJ237_04620 [bacterium]|nr:hypothetical protein [bacterium]